MTRLRYDLAIVATHIKPAKGYGGVAESTARLAREWSADRSRKIVLCASDASTTGRISPSQVLPQSDVHVKLFRSYWLRRWGFGLGAVPQLISACMASRHVYISGITTWPSTLAALICILLRKRFVVAPRGGLMPGYVSLIRQHHRVKWGYYRLLVIPTLRRASAVHCAGEMEADGVRDVVGNNVQVFMVPNGVDLDSWAIADTRLYGPDRELALCYVGRISPEKGINEFIQSWLMVARPRDRLIVVGSGTDGDYLGDFRDLVGKAAGRIEYRGYGDQQMVSEALAQSHFLVLPSGAWKESFGNVVVEALATGRPAIVARGLEWDQLPTQGAGFIFGHGADEARIVLDKASSLNHQAWLQMCESARELAKQFDGKRSSESVWEALMEYA